MLRKVIMPTLGLDMEEAVIEKWLKVEGETVVKDEPMLIVETEKATTEINAPASGVIRQILHRAGATVPVTHTIAYMETSEAEATPNGHTLETAELPLSGRETAAQDLAVPQSAVSSPRSPIFRASPAARKAAKDLGVDLSKVKGMGPAGRIHGEDVRRYAEEAGKASVQAPPAPMVASPAEAAPKVPVGLPGQLVPLARKRRVTAERMALSTRTVARLTLNREVDASEIIGLRSRLQAPYEARGLKLSYDALLVRVVSAALVEHPYLNSRWTDQGIYLVEPVNVGVAIAVEDGLVVPVIQGANRKSLTEIAEELSKLVAKAKEDRLSLEEMSGGTFTLTNLGMFGVDAFDPVVNPPETGILGVGRIVEKAVGVQGEIALRPRMNLSLSVDHRVVDGAPAAQFLQRVAQLIEEPYLLI